MPTTPPNSPSRGKHAWKGSTGRRDNNRRRMEFQNAHGPGPAQLAAIQKDFAGDFAKQAEQRSVDAHTACGGAVAKKTRRRRPRKSVYKPDFQACAKAAELHVREVRPPRVLRRLRTAQPPQVPPACTKGRRPQLRGVHHGGR